MSTHYGVRFTVIDKNFNLKRKEKWFKTEAGMEKFLARGDENGTINSIESYCTEERY